MKNACSKNLLFFLTFGFAENVEELSNRKEEENPAMAPEEQQKLLAKETSSEWKIPTLINKHASPVGLSRYHKNVL